MSTADTLTKARAVQVEQALIGCALMDATAVCAYALKWGITADALVADKRHPVIWQAICELEAEPVRVPGQPNVDQLTVTDYLRARGLFEVAGGSAYLSVCCDAAPTSDHAGHYVQIIHDLHMRNLVAFTAREVERMTQDPEVTPHDVVAKAINKFSKLLHRPDTKPNPEIVDDILDTWGDIRTAHQQGLPRRFLGTPIGFPKIDEIFSGVQPGLNILAGLPSAGKTTLACHALLNVALTGTPCAAIMMDITTRRTLGRMIANHSGVSLAKINKGHVYDGQWEKVLQSAEIMKKLPIHFLENEDDLDAVTSFMRVCAQSKGVKFFIGDYLQLISPYDLRREPEQVQIKHVARTLKKLSVDTDLRGLWLAQFNRSSAKEQRPPRLDDLHGASAIEKEATTAMLLYEWVKYPYPRNPDGTLDQNDECAQKKRRAVVVEIAKQQDGETGQFPFWFHAPYFKFHAAEDRWGLTPQQYQEIINPPKPERKERY